MNTNVKSFDDARAAKDTAEIRELLAIEEGSVARAIRLGELFTQRKEALGHGNWLPWLEAEGIHERTARRYMEVYEGSKSDSESDLDTHKKAQAAAAAKRAAEKLAYQQEEARKQAERQAKQEAKGAEPEKIGWVAAMTRFSGINQQWGGAQQKRIEKAMGLKLTGMKFTIAEAKQFAAQAALCFVETKEREKGTTADEKAVDKAIREELAKLRRDAAQALEAAVKERMAPILKEYGEAIDAAHKEKANYEAWAKNINDWMSYEDFQAVISCLHPDRAPAGMEEKYRKAFQIMNALRRRFK